MWNVGIQIGKNEDICHRGQYAEKILASEFLMKNSKINFRQMIRITVGKGEQITYQIKIVSNQQGSSMM